MIARFHDSLDAIDATAWGALVADGNPFVAHALLAGLERHGCIRAEWGWQPHHLGLYDGDRLVAAAPLYLKGNSHGEYVFDWGWADAWERAGGEYYPKLLCAVPYSPVPGPRLLAGDGAAAPALRQALAAAIGAETRRLGLSSAHADFLDADGAAAFDHDSATPWLARFDWQFHWHNRDYRDFEDFLAALRHKKRKNIRHERAQVAAAGIACTMQRGDTLSAADWQAVHALYLHTFDSKGNHATLSAAFFAHLATTFGDGMQVALARRGDGEPLAMALFLRSDTTLYGRYWGARVEVPGLHFELCYYQGIAYAIAAGLARFEPGAQGRHKLARGFLPARTQSRHYLVHEGFRAAVAAALADEADTLASYRHELLTHSPYAL
ncbi:MAG TPA: GNAT family N-acetyltransferase [Rhodanobacteraceae bacterium]|nr:GNAT family N-acetyltransferase [Rhodanobacteraceae bacterium]